MSAKIKVDVWSDIACPWCYIGKRRFEAGAAAFRERHPGVEVELEFHSFELSPDTPVDYEGSQLDYLVSRKGMAADQVRAMLDHVTGVAAEVGLAYDFDAVKPTSTVAAHQLLHYAKAHGRQLDVKERLLRAYFVEGRHVGRVEELAALAADVGLDGDDVLRSLRANEHLEAVHADQRQAAAYGIRGVPFFVIDRRYGVSGAQRAEAFAQALERIHGERTAVAS